MADLQKLFPGSSQAENVELASRILPAGVRVVAIWPAGTILPLEAALMEKMAVYGTPWKADLAAGDILHIGLDLTAPVKVAALLLALQEASGMIPGLFSVPDSWAFDNVISATETLKGLQESIRDVGESAGDLASGVISGVKFAIWAPVVVGGVLILAGLLYFGYQASQKIKDRA